MENEFFLGAGIPPPTLFEPSSSSANAMPTWKALPSAMEIQAPHEWLSNPGWEKSTVQNAHFDTALSAMASSVSNSNENSVIRELIGKLGNSGNTSEISPHSQRMLGAGGVYVSGNNSTDSSRYNTPLNSPPKLHLPKLPLSSNMADLSADPGFAERAAKFSCFGSRSFNGRTTQLGNGISSAEMNYRSNPSLLGCGKLFRVSSSPSIKALGSQLGATEKKTSPLQEESPVEQNPNEGLTNLNVSNELKTRKRKAASKGKGKEPASSSPSSPASKVSEGNDDSSEKRYKPNEVDKNNKTYTKADDDQKGNSDAAEDEKQAKANQKPSEPPKDYIHVRARRGQATDSHSLAERVRREKISERMKLLQDLVPGCNKVTGKALMLDEIINYVQSLQRQVEFLSMKLASVNTRLDYNVDTLVSKDMYPSSSSLPHPIFPLDSSAPAFFSHQLQHNPSISNAMVTQCSVEPLDSALCQNLDMQLPPLNGFNEVVPELPAFCEDDLQTIVQMGFGKSPNQDAALASHTFLGPNQVSNMKVEL